MTGDKLTRREDFNVRSIQELRNTIEVSGVITLSAVFTNDTVILHTPGTAGDAVTIPTDGRIGTMVTYINKGVVDGAIVVGISGSSASYTLEPDQGMIFVLSSGDVWLPTANAEVIQVEIDNRPTYTEIVSGFDDVTSGGTTTPTAPVISIAKGLFRAVYLLWDKQGDLTNLAYYDVQVSADETDWYSLQFNGTDWKDTLDNTTGVIAESIVHVNIPTTGDANAPEGQELFYRVRRVTKDDTTSDWSSVASATTLVIQGADLAADSVYANNIRTGTLSTLFLNAGEVNVGFTGTGETSDAVAGDRKTFIDGDEIQVQEYLGDDGTYDSTKWSTVNGAKIGGVDSNGVFISGVSCRQIKNPLAPEISQEFVPDSQFRVLTFETDYADQNGETPTSTINPSRSTNWSKYGSRSFIGSSAGLSGVLEYTGLVELNTNTGISLYTNIGGTFNWTGSPGEEKIFAVYNYVTASNTWFTKMTYEPNPGQLKATLYEAAGITQTQLVEVTIAITPAAFKTGDHFIGYFLDFDTNKLTLILDSETNDASFADPSFSGASTSNYIDLYGYRASLFGSNSKTFTSYIDDVCFSSSTSSTLDLFIQHYNHNVAWNTDYSAKDVILLPADGGVVNLSKSPTKPYAPVAGEESLGTPHFISLVDTPSQHSDTTVSDTWETVDYSLYVPSNTKGLLLYLDVTNSGSGAMLYCLRDYEEAYADLLHTRAGGNTSNVSNISTRNIIPVKATGGKFQYRRYSSSYPITTFACEIRGYYI